MIESDCSSVIFDAHQKLIGNDVIATKRSYKLIFVDVLRLIIIIEIFNYIRRLIGLYKSITVSQTIKDINVVTFIQSRNFLLKSLFMLTIIDFNYLAT